MRMFKNCALFEFGFAFRVEVSNCIFRPSRTVKLYFSVPVDLYIVFLDSKNLGQNPGQNFALKIGGQTLLTGGAG